MAVSVTVESSRIYLSGSGEITLDGVYTAIGDTSVMDRSGSDPYTYTIYGNRELEVRANVTLRFEEDDTLEWDLTASKSQLIDIQSKATWIVEAGFTLNLDKNNGHYNRIYLYGSSTFSGTEAKPIIIKRYYDNRIYNREGNNPHDWQYVEFQDPNSYSSGNNALSLNSDSDVKLAHSFKHIKLNNRTNSGYILSCNPFDWSSCTFDNWYCENTKYGISAYGSNIKFTNSTFKGIYYYNYLRGNGSNDTYVTYSNSTTPYTQQQPKITFENCTFEDNYTASSSHIGFVYAFSGVVKFKNCTFKGVSSTLTYGIRAYYSSKILLEGTQTFTNVTYEKSYGYNGTFLHVHSLDFTINGSDGSPLENAFVVVRQKEGKEVWSFVTDSNGKIKDCFGDNPVFVEKEEYSSGNYVNWSDGTGDKVHVITISHPDYEKYSTEITFDSDKTLTIQLTSNPEKQTKIYNSTIYNSTIY